MNGPHSPVAIIGGSGALGSGLALRLAGAGVPVIVGSRSQERAQEAVTKLKQQLPAGEFSPAPNEEAAKTAKIVILAVPFRNHSETLTNLKNSLQAGQIVVDTTVPLAAAVSGKATRILGVWQGSAAQQAQEMVPEGVEVVAALHTVSAKSLAELDHPMDEDVLIAGDSRESKHRVAQLIELIAGMRCVDAGKLEMARLIEQLTPLLISVNIHHKTHAGIKLTGLPDRLWD